MKGEQLRPLPLRTGADPAGLRPGGAIPQLPQGTAIAELVLWEDGEEYRDWGTWEEPGAWLFAFCNRKDSFGSGWLHGLPYELTAYGGDGTVLARQAGNVPDNYR